MKTSTAIKIMCVTIFMFFVSTNLVMAQIHYDSTTGNVGIGTTAPGAKLEVAGSLLQSAGEYHNFGSSAGASGYGIRDNSGTMQYKSSGGDWADIGFSSGSSEATPHAFSVHKNGSGQSIATSTWTKVTWATEVFDTDGDFDLVNERFVPSVAGKYLLTAGIQIETIFNESQGAMGIYKNGVLYARGSGCRVGANCGYNGVVSIIVEANGTTDYFEVYASQNTGGTQTISGDTFNTYFSGCRLDIGGGLWSNDSGYLYYNSGNVGIGTTSPDYKLHVIGDIAYTGNIYDVSDIRLKENITPLENAVEKVSSIHGIYFNNIGESPENREVGVIAQEVEEVLPEVVSEDNKGYKSVDYSKLTPLLIEAVKELKADINELRAENVALRARMEASGI